MLGLKWHDIDFRTRPATVFIKRRHDDPDDPRKRPPATKTRARELWLSDHVTGELKKWQKERANKSKFPNARKHPYVWVNEDGDPITAHGLSSIYQMLREKHRGALPANLSTHILRHDWNDRWIELIEASGESVEDNRSDQIYQNGWSDRTRMDMRYGARARQNRANERILRLQREHKTLEHKS
jgi:integrase